jgi:hypothetical protein
VLDGAHEAVLGDDRGVLVEVAGLRAPAAAPMAAGSVALEPGAAEPTL